MQTKSEIVQYNTSNEVYYKRFIWRSAYPKASTIE